MSDLFFVFLFKDCNICRKILCNNIRNNISGIFRLGYLIIKYRTHEIYLWIRVSTRLCINAIIVIVN